MCSDEVDSNAALTKAELKACHGFEELLSHLFSPDPIVQAYALGAVQNTCRESDYLGALWTLLEYARCAACIHRRGHLPHVHMRCS